MASTRTTKAALYARVSTLNGQDTGLQLDELRRVARARGWEVVQEFVDEGISGTKASRPGLDALMEAARLGRVDVVAVFRFDRFARSTKHLIEALERIGNLNALFGSLRKLT